MHIDPARVTEGGVYRNKQTGREVVVIRVMTFHSEGFCSGEEVIFHLKGDTCELKRSMEEFLRQYTLVEVP